jgi:hypothetical protein
MRYSMTDHCCRRCRGRILCSDDGVYVCAECGLITDDDDDCANHHVEDICCCGITLRGGKDARLRCTIIDREKRTAAVPYMLGVIRV